MTTKRTAIYAFLLGIGLVAGAMPARAQTVYDGLWSVLIITEEGDCDRGYRYAVRIRRGKVSHADAANSSFDIRGQVGKGGHIRVSVSRGKQRADGTGRMTRNGGAGHWRSAKGECKGIWTAHRRGT